MIREIEATFDCDECGTQFIIKLDPAFEPEAGDSLFSIAEDAIRKSNLGTYRDGFDNASGGAVIDERHYCQRCVLDADAAKGTNDVL